MTNKQRAIELAQRTANRENRTMLVLDISPLTGSMTGNYTVRDYNEHLLFSDMLVAVLEPKQTKQEK